MFLKLSFSVSFSVLFITIQYAIYRKSHRTFYVSLYICICNKKVSCVFSIRIYRQYTTEEGRRSVRKLWSFYYRFLGLKYHNYALDLCFVNE